MRNEAAFDEFYVGSCGRLLGQLTAMTADRELARDVVQEAYVKAWSRWGRVGRLDNPPLRWTAGADVYCDSNGRRRGRGQ